MQSLMLESSSKVGEHPLWAQYERLGSGVYVASGSIIKLWETKNPEIKHLQLEHLPSTSPSYIDTYRRILEREDNWRRIYLENPGKLMSMAEFLDYSPFSGRAFYELLVKTHSAGQPALERPIIASAKAECFNLHPGTPIGEFMDGLELLLGQAR